MVSALIRSYDDYMTQPWADIPSARRHEQEANDLLQALEAALSETSSRWLMPIGSTLDYWGDWNWVANTYPKDFLEAWVWGPLGEFVGIPRTPDVNREVQEFQNHYGRDRRFSSSGFCKGPFPMRNGMLVYCSDRGVYDHNSTILLGFKDYNSLDRHLIRFAQLAGIDHGR
ncbi:hypothetical protein KIKIMORA_02630 [Brevundimonas phage vB_BpoS-Kikimora]|uniref:Uncharacterized protein n=1 Tax=Brevundimonas phage vB_BpoS-Kikimora TaxID=2948601 RepID=A0A9E7MSS6_9CAUD|nr:hypothetical protein KIKIMORA_02630 [Brevundimonas phage vB_BpoS-Kikimora]